MDQQILEREKELFKLNAKLNAKTKRSNKNANSSNKPIQIITSNNNLNYYRAESPTPAEEADCLEVKCKKINITNQPSKKLSEVAYPLFNRNSLSRNKKACLNIHIPDSTSRELSQQTDANDEESFGGFTDAEVQTDRTESTKNDNQITRYSSETSIHIMSQTNTSTDVIPSSSIERKNISSDGLLKFLKSKVAMLQTELDQIKSQNDHMEKEATKLQKRLKKISSQHERSVVKIIELEKNVTTSEERRKIAEMTIIEKNCRIQELEAEVKMLNNNLQDISNEKQIGDKQLLKTQEDLEAAKVKLESYRGIEKTMTESAERERLVFEEKIRNLRKGKADLLKAYKQQIILIDNLRRQNICLEKAKALEICEKEFLKVLDWNFAE